MTYTRKNVWDLGDSWAAPILWYARGVKALQAKALDDATSWRFWAAMHGIDSQIWQADGYFTPGQALPSSGLVDRYWKQCQHGTWYFLPWHRGYLLKFEALVRAAIVALSGPADWALPYWNYFKDGQASLPPAFASTTWPDPGPNPLFIPLRFGPQGDGNVTIPLDLVNLDQLNDEVFTGTFRGGTPGFGGPVTGFHHDNGTHGGLETQPHDYVHGIVGGRSSSDGVVGLMSDPDTAALDPIFWLHHANIDRLWEIWRLNPPSHINPTDSRWLDGPASTGGQKFSVPNPDGSGYDYTPKDMVDLGTLGYTYDDFAPATALLSVSSRLAFLGASPAVANAVKERPVVPPGEAQLIGTNLDSLPIAGSKVKTDVALVRPQRQALISSFNKAAAGTVPDRVYLNLENVTGAADGAILKVYVGPSGQDPSAQPELLAGTVALFGVRKASKVDGDQAGQGVSYVLDITKIADQLHMNSALDVEKLTVSIVPLTPVPASDNIHVGRVSVYRQVP